MARKRIGELLLERGAITSAQLEAALQAQQRTHQRLGAALVSLGAITEKTLAHALSEALGVPVMDLAARTPDWSAIHLLRTRFCEQHELFPVALETVGGRRLLVVAMADPLDSAAVQEMEFTTGLKVSPRVAPLSAVRAAIQRYYHRPAPASAPASPTPAQPSVPEVLEDDVEEIIVGEELPPGENTRRVSLEQLIQEREQQRRRKRDQTRPTSSASTKRAGDISAELDSLFGDVLPAAPAALDPVEELERKFWALMRIMARKGLLTKEEFTRELDDESGS
ncbi:general secretion pathway protein GspE [Vitiosangium sp. GDMCC 1.1324]|uniref:GspE/PulE/PilB domain-containing protein n=1 Tax=Vitiosangium sp. (strain GDMCC 1.1324) TaxID=2138576 RepID=UPI000D36FFF6|nr:general secretion pathway protein GspE [Vitiosangium sp. GDMCC 1.1324]PTL83078.1 general secretion pathway protein GspE [Vitiosangium sp. GDMCC 1.1324]